ncbi:hypothetical protein BH24BAC1_BH24BAC1_38740 [soil metagenome]
MRIILAFRPSVLLLQVISAYQPPYSFSFLYTFFSIQFFTNSENS